jgi:hypothetical protein
MHPAIKSLAKFKACGIEQQYSILPISAENVLLHG